MTDIKLLTKEMDFAKLHLYILDWDMEMDGKPYDVYRIDDFYHTIGGKYGDNNYWCCPTGEEPSYDNLTAFNGQAPIWGIEYGQTNKYRIKWGDSRIEYRGKCIITRNGKPFYSFGSRDMEYGLAKAQVLLTEIREHPIMFHTRNWEESVIGRKVYYCSQPAIIKTIIDSSDGNLSIYIVPDKKYIDIFSRPAYLLGGEDHHDEWYNDYKNGVKDDILTKDIYWYRNE